MAGENEADRAADISNIPEPEGFIDAPIQKALGKRMRENCARTLAEPLPERLASLLERLKRQEEPPQD